MALAYPNDRDGGANRLAAIKQLEGKLAMAKRNGDAARVERYERELAAAKDAAKQWGTVPLCS